MRGGIQLPNLPDLPNVRQLDLAVLPMTGMMERAGIAVDLVGLAELSLEMDRKMKDLRVDVLLEVPQEFLEKVENFSLNSHDKLAMLLFDELGVGQGEPDDQSRPQVPRDVLQCTLSRRAVPLQMGHGDQRRPCQTKSG